MDDLISREAVLERYRVADPTGTFAQCSSILEFIESLPSAEAEPRWIPVAERLPEAETLVWMTTTWGGVTIGFRRAGNKEGWRGAFTSFYKCKEIIAWKPLKRPEPYKEG